MGVDTNREREDSLNDTNAKKTKKETNKKDPTKDLLATVSTLARHLREDLLMTGKAGMWCWTRAVRRGYW